LQATVSVGPGFPRAKDILEPDIGNIRLLIVKSAMQTLRDLVDTVLAVDIHSSINITKTPLTSTSCVGLHGRQFLTEEYFLGEGGTNLSIMGEKEFGTRICAVALLLVDFYS